MATRILEKEDISILLGVEQNDAFSVTTCDGHGRFVEVISNGAVSIGYVVVAMICLQGQAKISLNGFLYSIKESSLMLLLPGSVLRMVETSTDFRARLLVGKTKSEFEIADTFASFPDMSRNPVLTISQSEQLMLFRLFDYIAATTTDGTNIYQNGIVNKVFMLLCYEMANIYQQRFAQKMKISENEMIFHTFLDLVSNHSSGHRDVAFYAKRMRLSPKTFGDKIKKVTGKTPSEWIDKVVIDNSQTLLSTTDLTIKQVSERVGFPTPSLFCRYFRRLTGLSPLEWRHGRRNKQ